MPPKPTTTFSVRPPVVFTDLSAPLTTMFVRHVRIKADPPVVEEPRHDTATQQPMGKGGLVAAVVVGAVCLISLLVLLSRRILLPKYRIHKAFKEKKGKARDQKQWYTFPWNSSRHQHRGSQLDPFTPSNDDGDNRDVEHALRCIYPESSRRLSDLPLRNSTTPPESSPIVEHEVNMKPVPAQQLSPAKPLSLQGVPTQNICTRRSIRARNDSEYRVQTKGNHRNIDSVFVKIGAAAAEKLPMPRPSDEYITNRVSLDAGHRDNRGSGGTQMSHITTDASIVEAVKMDMRSVSLAVVDIVSPSVAGKTAHDPPPFVVSDGVNESDINTQS